MVATPDPFGSVDGKGLLILRDAGIDVDVGVCEPEARELLAPYLKKTTAGMPWVIAKWAMTWDGKIATASGDSQWISNEQSRGLVHQLRGRMDAIMVGANTASLDDPLLTARPPGPRKALRVVVDTNASLSSESQLAKTAKQFPLLIAAGPNPRGDHCQSLEELGIEIWRGQQADSNARLLDLLSTLADRGCTNLLVEGGEQLLGALFDLNQINEIHCFIGPKVLGGGESKTPIGGKGSPLVANAGQMRLIS